MDNTTSPQRPIALDEADDGSGAASPLAGDEASVAALRQLLNNSGGIDRVKAQLRALVYHSLAGRDDAELSSTAAPSVESMLVNEVVREYLQMSGFKHSLSVFESEARLAPSPVPRSIMAAETGLTGTPTSVPLLFGMLAEGRRAAGYA